jgi:hypothetical protein
MRKTLGRGLLQSLRARVEADVRELGRENKVLSRARYGPIRRFLHRWLVNRPARSLVAAYCGLIALLIVSEWAESRYAPSLLTPINDLWKDAAGFFLSAQVGILAILTVAIGVVTLLTQKDDGSSVNTDVRLYYFESYSYELATSGIILSIAILVQLFGPLQPLVAYLTNNMHAVDHFKSWVTLIHAAWLAMNFSLFLHFINTTLKFVEPDSRARLRTTYIANEIIPIDLKRRLTNAYYINLAGNIFGIEEIKKGPLISFGMGSLSDETSTVELSRSLDADSRLVDVWLLPLGLAVRSWLRRVRRKGARKRFSELHWDGHLAFIPSFSRTYEPHFDVVVRDGGVPLSWIERILIGISFRFSPAGPENDSRPTPTNFIEQLVSKLVSQIEAGLPTGFDDALKEVIDFHAFVLSAQNTRSEEGPRVNLAQVSDGPFMQPDHAWLREYRRAYTAATNKMTSDGSFVRGMSRLVVRLWPQGAAAYPPSVLQNILDLGRHQVVVFEDWVTRRAVIPPPETNVARDLAGSDLRAYEDALIHFVTSWESLQQIIVGSYELRHRPKASDEAYWRVTGESWATLQFHLRNAAYFLTSAVWNEDLAGSARFRDLLIRWIQSSTCR